MPLGASSEDTRLLTLSLGRAGGLQDLKLDPSVPSCGRRDRHGEGASIALGEWGEVGFVNGDGLLYLNVPRSMAGWLRQYLDDAILRGPEAGL